MESSSTGKAGEDLRQELRAAKLAAKWAPTTITASQTQSSPPSQQHSSTTQTDMPTYASVAIQADSGKKKKGKGKAGEPASTAVASASADEDIEMKDWSPYENLSHIYHQTDSTPSCHHTDRYHTSDHGGGGGKGLRGGRSMLCRFSFVFPLFDIIYSVLLASLWADP